MTALLRKFAHGVGKLLRPAPARGGRPRLMGMYLSHANRRKGAGILTSPNQQRHDGKFSQKRRRS